MSVEWKEAPLEVIVMASRIIDKYHPKLEDVSIGFIMRSEAPVSNGRVTYGKAKKISPELQVHLDFDFIIWLAEDQWSLLSQRQKEALLDHELSHCGYDGATTRMIPHDIEEFAHIIERHGFWWPTSDRFATAVQQALPLELEKRGGVRAVDVGKMAAANQAE